MDRFVCVAQIKKVNDIMTGVEQNMNDLLVSLSSCLLLVLLQLSKLLLHLLQLSLRLLSSSPSLVPSVFSLLILQMELLPLVGLLQDVIEPIHPYSIASHI